MKISELVRALKKKGCKLYEHGGNHDIWINPKTGAVSQVPRHTTKELGTGIVNSILKDLELK
ncbi:MAG: type II toxin-antitoxin system HicA family toxin [Dehalococcoidia bacterium]|nr:type II toxin-antitoxin system HicA family toxin [Dehalococcoidia bacterium]